MLTVYSSGSIAAQKLLFGYSQAGDLTPLFSHYFDTTTGAKVDATSYEKIAGSLEIPVNNILFLSGSFTELVAAKAAGMSVILLDRDNSIDNSEFDAVSSFDEICLSK